MYMVYVYNIRWYHFIYTEYFASSYSYILHIYFLCQTQEENDTEIEVVIFVSETSVNFCVEIQDRPKPQLLYSGTWYCAHVYRSRKIHNGAGAGGWRCKKSRVIFQRILKKCSYEHKMPTVFVQQHALH